TQTVNLLLAGVDVTNLDGPAFEVVSAESVVIDLENDTSNHLAEGTRRSGAQAVSAVVSSASDLKINGEGDLTIRANTGDGVWVEAGLAITGGTIDVMAQGDGIGAVDYIVLGAPDLTIISDGAGMTSTMTVDPDLGYISIAGGSYTIDAVGDAIAAGSDLYIYAGEFEVTGGGANVSADSSRVSLPWQRG
ncbi:MAG: carbohydrate-binding domain-containing protein, partial [Acidimicrobiia bacterium]